MLKERLNDYLNRKDLSKKAIEEVISIIAEQQYSTIEMIEELVEVLFGLKANAIYSFVCKRFRVVPDEFLAIFIDFCQNAINPNRFMHAFVLAIALCKQDKFVESNLILSYLVQNYILVQKINKQVYASLERAMHFDGADCLFMKWLGENARARNGYRKLLIEFLKVYPDVKYVDNVIRWFNVNDITIHSSEQAVIGMAQGQTKITSRQESRDEIGMVASTQKKESVDLINIPLKQLLDAVNNQCWQLSKKMKNLGAENTVLKKAQSALTDKIKSTELSLMTTESTINELNEKIKLQEFTISDLNRNLLGSRERIKELNAIISELNNKLSNVESAYGHAGQQEIDYLKGQIKKRLASEYSKYLEVKDKTPDLDYYDILLDMLDEIYHVLDKNGIKFD